jgi:hypothetical protein
VRAALRAAGHKRVKAPGGQAPVCVACQGRCRYAAAVAPDLPWLTGGDTKADSGAVAELVAMVGQQQRRRSSTPTAGART